MSIILEMDGNYPDISSGIVSFENARTGTKLTIELPKDILSGIYGIRSITMDTGAAGTILPENFAQRLDIRKPPDNYQIYYIFGGVGGMSVCYYSPDVVIVRVGDGMEQLEKSIFPFFLTCYAPSITSEGRLLAREEYQPHTSEILRFISPPFQHHDDYTVEVRSPDEIFSPQNRKLKLEVDVGNEIDYILIGRDWQERFRCTFEAQKIIITEFKKNLDKSDVICYYLPHARTKGIFSETSIKKGVFTIELFDIKNQFVRLKVFDGVEWVWKNYPVKLGRKQLEQLSDPSWLMQSPTLVPKRTKRGIEWYLHIPMAKEVKVKPIKEQQKENPNLTTLAVDLGLRHLAVVTVRQGSKIVFVKFFRGKEVEAHRLQHLQKVFRKQQKSGKSVRGERSNKKLWRHIRDTNIDIAHTMTSEIVEIARKYDIKVIVIEHLKKFQAFRGENRSKKLNRRLTIRRFVVGELILAQRSDRSATAV